MAVGRWRHSGYTAKWHCGQTDTQRISQLTGSRQTGMFPRITSWTLVTGSYHSHVTYHVTEAYHSHVTYYVTGAYHNHHTYHVTWSYHVVTGLRMWAYAAVVELVVFFFLSFFLSFSERDLFFFRILKSTRN